MKTAEEIAVDLSEAQKQALLDARQTSDGRWLVPTYQTGRWPAGICGYYSLKLSRLRPVGLAVRRILEDQRHD